MYLTSAAPLFAWHTARSPTNQATVRADDRAHVFHSWSAQGLIDPVPIARAEGSRFWDYDGRG